MNQLYTHISYLIGRHDCVIVPGFGAFIAERIPCRIDRETFTVIPAETRIGFNAELIDDDGMLIHSIARKARIGHQDARRIVEHSVRSLRERLEENRSIDFGAIGSFRLTDDGRKIFAPSRPASEPVCSLSPLENMAPAAVAQDSVVPDEKTEEGGLNLEEKWAETAEVNDERISDAPVAEERPAVSRAERIPAKVFVSRVACALVVLFAIIVGFTIQSPDSHPDVQKASVVPVESLMNIKKKNDTAEIAPKVPVKEVAPVKVVKPNRSEEMRFHLIVGTFSSREEAERFITLNEDTLADLTPIKGSREIWRVAAASSDDRKSLQADLNRLNSRFEGVWIWERR